jgi:hypothetical protein
LYFSEGRYSKYVLTGQWDQVKKEKFSAVTSFLEAKRQEQSRSGVEVPEFMEELLERLNKKAFSSHGVDLSWVFPESWTVKIIASKEGKVASTYFNYGSKRKGVTQEKIDGRHRPNGDSEMIALIKTLVETRGI